MKSRLAGLFLDGDEQNQNAVPGQPEKRKLTLLLVDDENAIIESLKRVFREENYRILSANSGDEALGLLETEEVQVILSDHRMPGMSGAEFLGKVKESWPDTIRIMLTGYADISSVMGAINTGAVYKFITKPWNDEDLRVTVGLAFEQYELMAENRELKEEAKQREDKIKKLSRYVEMNRSQLLTMLVKNGLLAQDQREKVQKSFQRTKKPYPVLLDELDYVSFDKVSGLVKARLGIDTVSPKEYEPPKALTDLFPEEFCRRNWVMPLKRLGQREILVGMADPTDMAMTEDIRFFTGFEITPTLAPAKELWEAMDRLFGLSPDKGPHAVTDEELMGQLAEFDPYESIEIVLEEEESDSVEDILKDSATPPAIRLVNLVLWEALKADASDIHIEKKVKNSVARFRVDGLLNDSVQFPESLHQAVVSRIKIMADLDIAERRRPQDGRVTVMARERTVDVRISCLPTINGEKVVMRLLDRNSSLIGLSELGTDEQDIERLTALVHKPQGMVLTTGPTGSGKTTTLYALMHEHSDPHVNYVTIEDPVEYFLEYAGQVLVKEKIGLNFPTILRSILRQDPNVILLGEIRDFETAEVSFHAALTGHLVMSTLHTNNTVATIARLLDLGVKPYIVASALEGVVAQRLVRKLCPHCREEAEPDPRTVELLGNPAIEKNYAPKGCSKCGGSGYHGRVGIFEVMVPTREMKKLIAENFSEDELLSMARANGMSTLQEAGINKVNQGETSLDEVFRVIGPQEVIKITCPECGAGAKDWMAYCPGCGHELKRICNGCGRLLQKEWLHCPGCGQTPGAKLGENAVPSRKALADVFEDEEGTSGGHTVVSTGVKEEPLALEHWDKE